MNCIKVGNLILNIRKEKGMTQKQLADIMGISDKTVSKWERGLGCPDVSLLKELSDILEINIEKILEGEIKESVSKGGNMKRIKFYICPTCQNVITSTSETDISCCGRRINALKPIKADEAHKLEAEEMDEGYYISFSHTMEKEHYISFAAYVTYDSVYIIKMYPEQAPEIRIPKMRKGKLYFHCTSHGLIEAETSVKRP